MDANGRTILVVALVAVAVGVIAFTIRFSGAHEAGSPPPVATPRFTASNSLPSQPRPCDVNRALAISGTLNDCGRQPVSAATANFCEVSSGRFDAVIRFGGAAGGYLLYVEADGNYRGAGSYELPAWPHAQLGVDDQIAKVALRQYVSGAFWQSLGGELIVNSDQRSGSVFAQLVFVGGGPTPPRSGIHVEGAWSCGSS